MRITERTRGSKLRRGPSARGLGGPLGPAGQLRGLSVAASRVIAGTAERSEMFLRSPPLEREAAHAVKVWRAFARRWRAIARPNWFSRCRRSTPGLREGFAVPISRRTRPATGAARSISGSVRGSRIPGARRARRGRCMQRRARLPSARDREPARPETYLQAAAGSQRHFSLAKVLLSAQPQRR